MSKLRVVRCRRCYVVYFVNDVTADFHKSCSIVNVPYSKFAPSRI